MTDQTSETTPDGLDVAAVRERVERATPGPWQEIGADWSDDGMMLSGYVIALSGNSDTSEDVTGDGVPAADAEFIAHARTDIPLLLAALDEARREVKHWKDHAEEAGEGFSRVCKDYARVAARNSELVRQLEAAESARDAAEGVARELRALIAALADEWGHPVDYYHRRQLCTACTHASRLRAVLDRLAPVTTDATAGNECPHGYRAPLNCGLCAGIDG